MTEGEFFATVIMMGWKKLGRNQVRKRINGREIIIMGRTDSALVMNSEHSKFRDQINDPISYGEIMQLVHEDFEFE